MVKKQCFIRLTSFVALFFYISEVVIHSRCNLCLYLCFSTVFNSHAVSFNRALDVCKLTGAVLFCVGGTSMAVGLLLSAFAKSYSKEELYLQQKFKERLADLQATVGESLMNYWITILMAEFTEQHHLIYFDSIELT